MIHNFPEVISSETEKLFPGKQSLSRTQQYDILVIVLRIYCSYISMGLTSYVDPINTTCYG